MSDVPQVTKSLEDYLLDQHNQNLLTQIERIGLKPLPFFNLLYELVDLVKENKSSQALQRLDGIEVFKAGGLRLFLLHCIRDHIRHPFIEGLGTFSKSDEDRKHHAALFLIDREYEEVSKRFPPELFPDDPENSISDRARGEVGASDMINQVLVNMIKKSIEEGREKAKLEEEITLRVRQEERERLREEVSNVAQEVLKSVRQPRLNPEFTTNRQVIALCYLLKAAGGSANSSEQARFIEFLTNKTPKEIYKRVLAISDTVFTLDGKDAVYVRDWFLKLGLTDLAKRIDEILDRPSEKL